MAKETAVTLRAGDGEKAEWVAAAEAEGMTLSKWIRSLIEARLAGKVLLRPAELQALQALTDQVRRVGTNLNQIAYAGNTYRTLEPDNLALLADLQEQLGALLKQASDMLDHGRAKPAKK